MTEKPQCAVVMTLTVESMKPNKLKHHFDTKHSNFDLRTNLIASRKADLIMGQAPTTKRALKITISAQ